MAARQLRCFVAMAVGRTDTDRIYETYIKPTVHSLGILSVFMGRLEHNNNIDAQIIQEIKRCDFAIADLTYARPSVYFEAGYAEHRVPVIYTARKDHLTPHVDADSDNRRVHFDLLMRNIITWSNENDPIFSGKLARRISKVVAPLLKQREFDERARAQEVQFQRLSLASRIENVYEAFKKTLRRCGYRALDESSPWIGRIPSGGTLDVGVVHVRPSFAEKDMRLFEDSYVIDLLKSHFQSAAVDGRDWRDPAWRHHWLDTYKRVFVRVVLCSLESTSRARLGRAFPLYTAADEGGRVLTMDTEWPGKDHRWLPASLSVHVVDGIKSVAAATKKSEELNRSFRRRQPRR